MGRKCGRLCWQKSRVNNMARAIVNNFGKSACYVSIGQLTSNLYTREVAESVQASVNAAIDEESNIIIPKFKECDCAKENCALWLGDIVNEAENVAEYGHCGLIKR